MDDIEIAIDEETAFLDRLLAVQEIIIYTEREALMILIGDALDNISEMEIKNRQGTFDF